MGLPGNSGRGVLSPWPNTPPCGRQAVNRITSSSNATVYAVDAAESSFAASFKVICLTVEEQARLVDVAEEALDFAQRTYEITAKKYELGMVSYEEYLADQSDVQQAQSDLYSAQLEVFSAYRNYLWAVNYGIV